MEYVITKCSSYTPPPAQTNNGMSKSPMSQSASYCSDFAGGVPSNNSVSTDPFNRSYEDDRRSLVESIRNILLAKVETIIKTVPGIDLENQLATIRNWKVEWSAPTQQPQQKQTV